MAKQLIKLKAKRELIPFLSYLNPTYDPNWHHFHIANKIESFLSDPEKKKLALFVPPQHGKSEITSRGLPAFLLGQNPNLKICLASYSGGVSKLFNRAVQRNIASSEYRSIFPDTKLSHQRNTNEDQAMKTSSEFELVGKRGGLVSVGITGALTSRTVDIAIIDDPVKDEIEASSETYRERAWEWYTNVLETRLHNDSKVILIMTRWHEDDLGGRLLEAQPDKWEVVHIRAIKTQYCTLEEDPRDIGEALWPEKHSLQRLMDIKDLNPSTFDSLYQGDPGDPLGNYFKKDWFVYRDKIPDGYRIEWKVFIDGAYTEKKKNDPSAIWVAGLIGANKAIVAHVESVRLEMPALLKHIPLVLDKLGLSIQMIKIEPKANGLSLIQMLREDTRYPVSAIGGPLVKEGKTARAAVGSKWVEGGKVEFLRAPWNKEVEHQLTKFPKATHDEYIDLMGYMADDFFGSFNQEPTINRIN